jgi:hypothetical protein
MSRVTQMPARLALWLCIASALAIFPSAVQADQDGTPPGTAQTVQYDFEGEIPGVGGVLVIRIQSEIVGSLPGELRLSSPSGTRIGPSIGDIYLPDPVSGLYRLQVIGLQPGVYTLFLTGHGNRGSSAQVSFPHVAINPGEVHDYQINFSNDGSVKLEARRTR